MADQIDPKVVEDAKKLEELKKSLAEQQKKLDEDRKAFEASKKATGPGPLKTSGSIYIPSTFDNVTLFKFGTVSIGGIKSVRIEPTYKRVEPESNDITSGPIASHVVDKRYSLTVETEDVGAITSISSSAAPQSVSFVWEATANPIGTPTLAGNQLVTVTSCVFDGPVYNANMKAVGTVTVKMHTVGTPDNSDQFSMAASS